MKVPDSLLADYPPPLDRLLTVGEGPPSADEPGKQECFAADLAITAEHVPGLIRMLRDDRLHDAEAESGLFWAPVYAWRLLGWLRAEDAVQPLLGLLRRWEEDQDEWVLREVPGMLGEIGAAAVEPTREYLANAAHGEWARGAAAEALVAIASQHAELRDACVAALREQLGNFPAQPEGLNANLICALLDLSAVEALPDMKRAFDAEQVDESVRGDYEDIEIKLGLRSERTRPRRPNSLTKWRDVMRGALNDALVARLPMSEPPPASARLETHLPEEPNAPAGPARRSHKIGRNDPCPCGSGRKYKKCCGAG